MWPVLRTSSDAGAPVANVRMQSINFRIVFNTPAKACWSLIVNRREQASGYSELGTELNSPRVASARARAFESHKSFAV